MPWLGFVFLMGHMSINHIHRQNINAPDKVDVTGEYFQEPSTYYANRQIIRGPDGVDHEGDAFPG